MPNILLFINNLLDLMINKRDLIAPKDCNIDFKNRLELSP